jgi:benzylsuccinate CoA-transferase BbsE subunit
MPDPIVAGGLNESPLRDLSVLEVPGEFTAYAGWLLADLGADVTRVSFADYFEEPEWWRLGVEKRSIEFDLTTPAGSAGFSRLIDESDVVLQSGGAEARAIPELQPSAVHQQHPRLVHAILSPYGSAGPKANCASTDLVRLSAGGLLWLGGYPDAEPVAPYGNQSALCTGIFAVIAVLLATLERDRTGVGCVLDVSAQEVMVQALETSLADYELLGNVRSRAGSTPREAGTGIYPCADGFISMVAGRLGTASAWRRLREWLVEAELPGAEELFQEDWESLTFRQRPESVDRFSELFSAFTATRSKQELYVEAQLRSIALAPVNTPSEVLEDPQLCARNFFREVTDPATGARAMVPGAPYRFGSARPTAVAR